MRYAQPERNGRIEHIIRVFLACLAVLVIGLFLSLVAFGIKSAIGAVDCEMASKMAAGMTREQLATMGTPEQRKQYAHCFQKPKKKHRPNMRRN